MIFKNWFLKNLFFFNLKFAIPKFAIPKFATSDLKFSISVFLKNFTNSPNHWSVRISRTLCNDPFSFELRLFSTNRVNKLSLSNRYISVLNPHRCHQNSNLFLKFLMMSVLVLLSVVLYVVASSYHVVLGMRSNHNAYLISESSSSSSPFQANQSYCISSTCVQTGRQI